MALREKLNNLAATATSKANSLAATATSKANSAIETGKLNLKINTEEKKIAEFTLNMGDLLLDKLDAGEVFDDEIMALYDSIQAARKVIEEARADIEAYRQAAEPTCAECGAPLADDAKFCGKCGTKVEELAPEVVVEVEEVPAACAACGALLEEEANFCNQCGAKVEEPAEACQCGCTCGEEAPAEEAPAVEVAEEKPAE